MKINDRRNNKLLFESLEVGEVFMWEGSFWLKIRPCTATGITCNAVDVTNGTFAHFEESDIVEEIDAELTIR